MNKAAKIRAERRLIEDRRERLIEKDWELVYKLRALRARCPHVNLVRAATGEICPDCGATTDNHKF